MDQVDTSPRLNPDDDVRFLDDLRPVLPDGAYTLSVRHEVPELGVAASQSMQFAVAGPRFALDPSEIAMQFPPPGGSGAFGAVLPHISLKRGTLPWERYATSERDAEGHGLTRAHKQPADAPSWLALFVFEEAEVEGRVSIVPASDLLGTPAARAGTTFVPLQAGPGDDPTTRVRVIDLPSELARAMVPDPFDLRYLTSARQVNTSAPHGLVMARRLPKPGVRNVVHLVSLEHQYRLDPNADRRHSWWHTHQHWSEKVAPGAHMRFISLASWSFFCTEAPGDLETILSSVRMRDLCHDAPTVSRSHAAVAGGWTPVEYRMRDGMKTAAWYRGPLQTGPRTGPAKVPVRHADDLLRREGASGMVEISHAAAWQLGRLLMLRNADVTRALYQWKRKVAQATHMKRHEELAQELAHDTSEDPSMPVAVTNWFRNRLGRLQGVPFDYLIPDAALLPPESLALFKLDAQWMAALFDGAFSIGRDSTRYFDQDKTLRADLPASATSGVMLRSRAVSGWPDLIVEGITNDGPVHPVRYERLSKDTLLALFDTKVSDVIMHPPLQAIHFGFDGTQTTGLSKAGIALMYSDDARRLVDVRLLAINFGARGSHDFAARMIEGVPKVQRGVNLP